MSEWASKNMPPAAAEGRAVARRSILDMRVGRGTLLLVLVFLLALLALTLGVLDSPLLGRADAAVLLTFFLNLVVAVAMLVLDCVRRPFSLVQIECLFVIIFFCVAPLVQYIEGYSAWDYVLDDDDYLRTNVFVMLWQAVFALSLFVSGARRADASARSGAPTEDSSGSSAPWPLGANSPTVSRSAVLGLAVLSLICTGILIYLVGLENLFARSTYDLTSVLGQTAALVVDKILRATPLFAFVFAWLRNLREHDCGLILAVDAALLLVADFPFAMARYQMAVIYLGLLLLCIPAFTRQRGLFAVFFLLVFLVAFPASNVFRREAFSVASLVQSTLDALGNLGGGFQSGDYDAYSMLARAFIYVQDYGVSLGYQLLGALLFFVPRSIWGGKPYGSGYTIATSQLQSYTNLSCPLPAEGIMNFGVVGLVLFAVVLGRLCRWADARAWRDRGRYSLFYPFACLYLFFMMRGDLMSSLAYFVGYLVVFAVLQWLAFGYASHGRDSRVRGVGRPTAWVHMKGGAHDR